MLTREQILEVDTYCAEHQISQNQYLDEHNIPRHQYYVWKRKYRQEELRPGGEFVSPMMPPAKTSGKAKAKTGSVENRESFLTVDIRTAPTPCPHLSRCPRIRTTWSTWISYFVANYFVLYSDHCKVQFYFCLFRSGAKVMPHNFSQEVSCALE